MGILADQGERPTNMPSRILVYGDSIQSQVRVVLGTDGTDSRHLQIGSSEHVDHRREG